MASRLTNHQGVTFFKKQLYCTLLAWKHVFWVTISMQEWGNKELQKYMSPCQNKKKTKAYQTPWSTLPIIMISIP